MRGIRCSKCNSPNVYQQDGQNACMMCGERFPIVFKQSAKSNAVAVPEQKTEETPTEIAQHSYEREFMKNRMSDLHNHLFEQLERLNNETVKGAKLTEEITRAKAMTGVAHEIILNGKLVLDALVATKVHGISLVPQLLENQQEQAKKK